MMTKKELLKVSNEVWKPIVGFDIRYRISNFSQVKRLSRKVNTGNKGFRILPEKILTISKDDKNVRFVRIVNNDGIFKNKTIHRLVMEAFIPNVENKPTINHIDGDRGNNGLSNLEWSTWEENNSHAYRTGLSNPILNLPDNRRKVQMIDKYTNTAIAKFDSLSEAAKQFNGCVVGIHNVCNNKPHCKTAFGYKWKYI